jgi:hypothetical protein
MSKMYAKQQRTLFKTPVLYLENVFHIFCLAYKSCNCEIPFPVYTCLTKLLPYGQKVPAVCTQECNRVMVYFTS